jgi:hypothetical protein
MSRIPVHVSSSAVHGAYISRTTLGMVAPVLSLNDFVYSDIMLNMSCLFVSRSNDNAHGLATSFYFLSTQCWKSGADSCVKLPRCFRGENTEDRPSGTLVHVLAGKKEVAAVGGHRGDMLDHKQVVSSSCCF